ncbi:Na+/H+ antiporter NhaA [Streptomyces sp. NPDC005151]
MPDGQRAVHGLRLPVTGLFLVARIELNRELVVGELRTRPPQPCRSSRPCVRPGGPAAVCAATATVGGGSLDGSEVPMATDIPFALAVLAVLSTHRPSALRAFPPTLAVVDDRGPARSPTASPPSRRTGRSAVRSH